MLIASVQVNELQAGDLLFVRSIKASWKRKLIIFGQSVVGGRSKNKRVVHTAIFLGVTGNNTPIIVQASEDSRRVETVPFANFQKSYSNDHVHVVRTDCPTKAREAARLAAHQAGRSYSFVAALASLFHRGTTCNKSQRTFYCSKLISYALNKAYGETIAPKEVCPMTLWDFMMERVHVRAKRVFNHFELSFPVMETHAPKALSHNDAAAQAKKMA
jgi:hypothetical protein